MYRNTNYLSQNGRYQKRRSFVLESDFPEGKTTFIEFIFLFCKKNHFWIEIIAMYTLYIDNKFPSMLLLYAYLPTTSFMQYIRFYSPCEAGIHDRGNHHADESAPKHSGQIDATEPRSSHTAPD